MTKCARVWTLRHTPEVFNAGSALLLRLRLGNIGFKFVEFAV